MLSRRRGQATFRHSAELSIPYDDLRHDVGAAKQASARASCVALITHFLLTTRGLAHTSLDELRKVSYAFHSSADSNGRQRKRVPSSLKKVDKFLGIADSSLAALESELRSLQPGERATVALVFGASPARAKEVYTVTFEDQTSSVSAGTLHDPISTDVDTRVQQARKCLTRALLKQYENVAAWQEALPGGTKLHILVHKRTADESLDSAADAAGSAQPAAVSGGAADSAADAQPWPAGDAGADHAATLANDAGDLSGDGSGEEDAVVHVHASNPARASTRLPRRPSPIFLPRPHLSRALHPTSCQAPVQVHLRVVSRESSAQGAGGAARRHHHHRTADPRVQATPAQRPSPLLSVSQLSAATARLSMGMNRDTAMTAATSLQYPSSPTYDADNSAPVQSDEEMQTASDTGDTEDGEADSPGATAGPYTGWRARHAAEGDSGVQERTHTVCLGRIPPASAAPAADQGDTGAGSQDEEGVWWQCTASIKGLPCRNKSQEQM